jgi:hypothetical protein
MRCAKTMHKAGCVVSDPPTKSHCGHSATVIISVSNPHTKSAIQSVVYIWNIL